MPSFSYSWYWQTFVTGSGERGQQPSGYLWQILAMLSLACTASCFIRPKSQCICPLEGAPQLFFLGLIPASSMHTKTNTFLLLGVCLWTPWHTGYNRLLSPALVCLDFSTPSPPPLPTPPNFGLIQFLLSIEYVCPNKLRCPLHILLQNWGCHTLVKGIYNTTLKWNTFCVCIFHGASRGLAVVRVYKLGTQVTGMIVSLYSCSTWHTGMSYGCCS